MYRSLYDRALSLPGPQRMRPAHPVSRQLISHMSTHPAVCRSVCNHDKNVTRFGRQSIYSLVARPSLFLVLITWNRTNSKIRDDMHSHDNSDNSDNLDLPSTIQNITFQYQLYETLKLHLPFTECMQV